MNHLEEALEAKKNDAVEAWVQSFLALEEKNGGLAEGLKKHKRYWVGPIEIDLARLPRITGPEDHMEYKVGKEGWDAKTQRMVADIKKGWKPAPLIAEYRGDHLSLRDGNHRREALEAAGLSKYWTVTWFNSEDDLKQSGF